MLLTTVFFKKGVAAEDLPTLLALEDNIMLMLLTTVFIEAGVAAEEKPALHAFDDTRLPEPMTFNMGGHFAGNAGFILAPWTFVVLSGRVFICQLVLSRFFGERFGFRFITYIDSLVFTIIFL